MTGERNLRNIVPTMTDGDIFRLYKHPEEFPQVQIDTSDPLMGGIWQRRWRQAALLNTGLTEQELLSQGDEPSVIRAMYIAEATAYHAWWDMMTLHLQFNHFTPAGRDLAAWLAEANAPPGMDLQQAAEQWEKDHRKDYDRAAAYLKAHHEDGQSRYQLLRDVADDTLQTGQHLAYIGLYLDLPDLLAHGRRTSTLAAARLWDRVSKQALDDDVFRQATQSDTPGQQATSHVDLIVRESTTGNGTDEKIIREFAAQAYTFRWASRAADRNMDRLSDLGSQDGGIAGQLRMLSDEIFHDRKHHLVEQAALHLGDRKQQETDRAFGQLHHVEETIAAVALGQDLRRHTDRNAPEPRPAMQDLLRHLSQEDPIPELTALALAAKTSPAWKSFYRRNDQQTPLDRPQPTG